MADPKPKRPSVIHLSESRKALIEELAKTATPIKVDPSKAI
jgi:hypothetical protein